MKGTVLQSVQGSGLMRGYRSDSTGPGNGPVDPIDSSFAGLDCSVGIWGGAPVGWSWPVKGCAVRSLWM